MTSAVYRGGKALNQTYKYNNLPYRKCLFFLFLHELQMKMYVCYVDTCLIKLSKRYLADVKEKMCLMSYYRASFCVISLIMHDSSVK